jgi:hypothetical protein
VGEVSKAASEREWLITELKQELDEVACLA